MNRRRGATEKGRATLRGQECEGGRSNLCVRGETRRPNGPKNEGITYKNSRSALVLLISAKRCRLIDNAETHEERDGW